VVVNGSKSSSVNVRSGVPQSSVLGPCLFIAYINDLPENLDANTRLFADDTALYARITCTSDQEQLQRDLNCLANWEEKWDMKFHPQKCMAMSVTRKMQPMISSYELHGHTLEKVDSAKYLGITIHSKMNWESHITAITAKANKSLGFLRRNLKISSTAIKERAYMTYVRPLLEYASTVWDCHSQKNIDRLEAVQRRAARFVLGRYQNTSSVSNMMAALKWPSLASRRKKARLAMLYKIQHGMARCPVICSKLQQAPERQRRSHSQQLKLIPARTNYRAESFLPTTICDWNALPNHIIEAGSLDTFVSRLDCLDI